MRLPLVRLSLRWLLVFVALVGLMLGAERLGRRSEQYRKQAALCAYFELQHQGYAASAMGDDEQQGLTVEEKTEIATGELIESRRYGHLKDVYRRVGRHPWESLPPDIPSSVNAWDLGRLSAAEIEEMVKDRKEY